MPEGGENSSACICISDNVQQPLSTCIGNPGLIAVNQLMYLRNMGMDPCTDISTCTNKAVYLTFDLQAVQVAELCA